MARGLEKKTVIPVLKSLMNQEEGSKEVKDGSDKWPELERRQGFFSGGLKSPGTALVSKEEVECITLLKQNTPW